MPCDKRRYPSTAQAKDAVKTMGQRVRVYYCHECGGYHVTKDRDGNPARTSRAWRAKSRKGKQHDKMERRNRLRETLEQDTDAG